jgi:predicted DNA-binding transcriptional regulator AlpA
MDQMQLQLPDVHAFVDATEAARIVGRSRPTITDMGHRGVLTPLRISGRVLVYSRSEVEHVAQALRVVAARR